MTRSLAFALAIALAPAGAFAQSPSQTPAKAPDRAAVRAACEADFRQNCPGIQPGGGRLAACLKEKRAAFSQECLATLRSARAQRPGN